MKKIYLFKVRAKRHLQSALSRELLKKTRNKLNGLPYYSVSHKYSNGVVYIAICVSSKSCGVDIEILKNVRKPLLNFFDHKEYDRLRIKNKTLALFMLWTAKEAINKKLRSDKDIRKDIHLKKTCKNKLYFTKDNTEFNVKTTILRTNTATLVLSATD